MHAKYNSLSLRPGPSPKVPVNTVGVDHEDRPKPDLMSTRYPLWDIESLGGYTRELISCQPMREKSWEEPPLFRPQTIV